MSPTSRCSGIAPRTRGFTCLVDALEYAATGDTGVNFYDGSGALYAAITYKDLQDQAIALAQKLASLGLARGSRVGIVAETDPLFPRFFFACQYAGLIPVAMPAGLQMGGAKSVIRMRSRPAGMCVPPSTSPRGAST